MPLRMTLLLQLLAAPCPGTPSSVHDAVTAVAAQMRENIKLRRAFLINSQNGEAELHANVNERVCVSCVGPVWPTVWVCDNQDCQGLVAYAAAVMST